MEFWAKTTADDKPGISVIKHMVNVGCVAQCLADADPDSLHRFQIRAAEVGALAAFHDLGKISPGFQQKCKVWLEKNHLQKIAIAGRWDSAMESAHGRVTHAAVQHFLVGIGVNNRTAKFLSAVLGGHHGTLNPPKDRGYKPPLDKQISEPHSGIDWDSERKAAASTICETFHTDFAGLNVNAESPSLWWLAGLTSVADWIGSDIRFFSDEEGDSGEHSAISAQRAIREVGFSKLEIKADLSFHDLFHDPQRPEIQVIPYEMQLQAIASITGPGVYVIEAPMGMGKTEAALWERMRAMIAVLGSVQFFQALQSPKKICFAAC